MRGESTQLQPELFETNRHESTKDDIKNWGTFKDSLRAPVHRWFTYPAGFSYKAVQHSIERFGITPGMTVYDPFMGSGTTNLTCKSLGIDSVGVEAHPFVYRITKAKMNWELDQAEARAFLTECDKSFDKRLEKTVSAKRFSLEDQFPDLVLKCYSENTLARLYVLKEILFAANISEGTRNFYFVVITGLLREVSSAHTGWPYIAPNKVKTSSEGKDVLSEFRRLSLRMLDDINKVRERSSGESEHRIIQGDSRSTVRQIAERSVDHVFTSPPYLNNFDYSDRTRLEMYFWGDAKTWGDISKIVRTKLITSATTQISRSDAKYMLLPDFRTECPKVTAFLDGAVESLGALRMTKGGKKSYDLMVVGYFNDMYKIIKDVYRVLKPRTKALFVLGDSAPYGIHIPTDRLIGEIGRDIGFNCFSIEVLRTRGGKWKENPQRHNVPLQESIVILEKNK